MARSAPARPRAPLLIAAAAAAGLAIYSQTLAWHNDEGLHLLAAKLLLAGRLPYREFFYQHPPGYALVCAGWMRLFGESWRSAHALSTVLASAVLYLTARLAMTLVDRSRQAIATAAAIVLMALQTGVLRFATIGQPYALCLMLGVGSAVLLTDSRGPRSFAAGCCAGAAVCSSLLMSPALVVELVWLWTRSGSARRSGARWFLIGSAAGLAPLAALVALAPHAAFFDLVQFNAIYRWGASSVGVIAPARDVLWDQARVIADGIRSPQVWLLLGLAAVGLRAPGSLDRWSPGALAPGERNAARLCTWIAIVTSACLMIPHPTFPQYFVLAVPFVSVVSAAGFAGLWSRAGPRRGPLLAAALFVLYGAAAGIALFRERAFIYRYWSEVDEVMAEADRETPPGGELYAVNENLYFASRRLPPDGLENTYASGNGVPSGLARMAHIVSQQEIDAWLASGRFATAVIYEDDERAPALGRLYRQRRAMGAHHDRYLVLWDRVKP